MRLDFGEGAFVSVEGVQRILWNGETHIGALDDETGHYVLGPLVHDRMRDSPMRAHYYAVGKGRGHVPVLPTIPNETYDMINHTLDVVAEQLGVEVKRGIDG